MIEDEWLASFWDLLLSLLVLIVVPAVSLRELLVRVAWYRNGQEAEESMGVIPSLLVLVCLERAQ